MKLKENFLNEIMNCQWLNRCGVEDEFDFEVEFIKSLKNAEKSINSVKWENMCLERGSDFTSFLARNYKDEYNRFWNDIVRMIKRDYFPQIIKKIDAILLEKGFSNSIVEDIKFNLITLFMLNFYSDYYSDEFWVHMLSVYLSGHIPCGWAGNYPEGKLMIY